MVIYSERCVAESNRLKWFCRPVPDRSDNAPCFISFSKANAKVVLLFLLSKYFVYFFSWPFFFLFSLLAVVHILYRKFFMPISCRTPDSVRPGLFRFFQPASFCALVASVVVEFYFHIRFLELAVVWQEKLHVLDAQSPVYPLVLVVGVYAKNLPCALVESIRVVQVLCSKQHW